jgi:hypothetical protein
MPVITKIIPQIQKVFIDNRNEGTVTCPGCQKSRRANLSQYKGVCEIIKVKCGCGCAFGMIIDQRKHYRKKTQFSGNYTVLGTDKSGRMIVEDLSFTGIGFRTRLAHSLEVGELVEVRFVLDDQRRSEVCKMARIRRIQERSIAAEFCDLKAYEKDLGYYLMPA